MDSHGNALPEGYRLHWYRIGRVLGQGGFGITYEAFDTNLEKSVAIKEYLPTEFAVREKDTTVRPFTEDRKQMYEWGLDRFLQEARTLAKFHHPNIVLVHNVFEKNGTAYMAMQYEQGESLNQLFKLGRLCSETELLGIALPLLDGIEHMHEAGFIHRDIKPPNIYVRLDGSPVLLDFGSARFAIGNETKTLTSLVSPGFAPYEQYHNEQGKQGPWTDIYGLGATLYAGINRGRGPIDAIVRGHARIEGKPDPLETAAEIGKGNYSEAFLHAIDAAIGFTPDERPRTVAEWRTLFPTTDGQTTKAATAAAARPLSEADIPTLIHADASTPDKPGSQVPYKWIFAFFILILFAAGAYFLLPQRPATTDSVAQQETSSLEQQRLVEEAVQRALQAETQRQQEAEQARLAREAELAKDRESRERLAAQMAEQQARLEAERKQAAQQEAASKMQQRITALLAEGNKALSASRLTSPTGDNAMEYYQSVLQLDASNIPAKKGIGKIVTRYLDLAHRAAEKNEWENADRYINKAAKIDPDGDSILSARKQITRLRDEAERKLMARKELERKRIEELEQKRLAEEQAAATSKFSIAMVTWGETKKRSLDYVSDKLKIVFMKAITEKSTYDENELVTSEVEVSLFSKKYALNKSTAICSENQVSIILGAYFDHGMGGRTGQLELASFDCKTRHYTKKSYPVEFDTSISKWGPSWKRAMKRFLDETGVFSKPNQ